MTDERTRNRYEMRAFFAQFRGWVPIMVAFTVGATVLGVAVALVMLIPSRS